MHPLSLTSFLPNTLMESTANIVGQDQSSKRAGSLASTLSSSLSQSSRKENVEDAWKEINLASLHDYPITTTITTIGTNMSATITETHSFLGSMFLDYLGKGSDASSDKMSSSFEKMGLSNSPFLTLNNASGCQYTGMTDTAGPLTSSCKRRVGENADEFHEKKFKRLMNNRESAARSRARKQAYTNELELEVVRLQQENARLRRFKEMLSANHAQNQKKSTLRRTLTCLF